MILQSLMEKLITLVLTIALINVSVCGIIQFQSQNDPSAQNLALTDRFILSFEYACQYTASFESCTGNVKWNNDILYLILPNNYNINSVNILVVIKNGTNSLSFAGTGKSDRIGLTIDNVRLVRDRPSSQNIVINGNFQEPFSTNDYNMYEKYIPGWRGKRIQLGRGSYYNQNWSSRVCQLDGDQNYEITQDFQFNELNYLMRLFMQSCKINEVCEGFYEDDRFC